jgi:hypothetical protein
MTKLIYEVFDKKSRTLTVFDLSNPELLISHRTWSKLSKEEKQHIYKTLNDTCSSSSKGFVMQIN